MLDRCFIRREVQDWSAQPYRLPVQVEFNPTDKQLGRASEGAWREMQFKGPIHCNDAFVVRPTSSGALETLTVERQEWPLNGERWMVGGRDITPPADHPLADAWLPDHSMLLSIYRELEIQPAQIFRAYPLLDAQLTFKSPEDPTKMKQTPATLWVLLINGDESVTLNEKESQKPLWLELDTLSEPRMSHIGLSDYMKYGLCKLQEGIPALRAALPKEGEEISQLEFPH